MTGPEFDSWSTRSRDGFAAQQVASGLQPAAEARAFAEQQLAQLLPAGRATPQHHLWTVRADAVTVGHVWLRVRPLSTEIEGFVFDVELVPAARGQGLGRATMLAAEDAARTLGATVVRLNVFGHNSPAIRLYESLGYDVARAALTRRTEDAVSHPTPVELRDSTAGEYRAFRARVEQERTDDLVRADVLPSAEARHQVADDLARLLPRGRDSPGQLLRTAYDGGDRIGTAWVQVVARSDGPHAYVHDLTGGPEVVRAVLATCGERGVVTVEVSVPGFDRDARTDYERAGFGLTAQTMVKRLRPRDRGALRVGSPR